MIMMKVYKDVYKIVTIAQFTGRKYLKNLSAQQSMTKQIP